jgi:hypothetical protein
MPATSKVTLHTMLGSDAKATASWPPPGRFGRASHHPNSSARRRLAIIETRSR